MLYIEYGRWNRENPLFSIIEKNFELWFFLAEGIICELAHITWSCFCLELKSKNLTILHLLELWISVSVIVVNFSHFHFLQNHGVDFNQTWYKVSLGERDSSLLNFYIGKYRNILFKLSGKAFNQKSSNLCVNTGCSY